MTTRTLLAAEKAPPGRAQFRRSGDDLWAEWPDYLVRMRFSELSEEKGGYHSNYAIFVDLPNAPSPADWGQMNLSASQTRSGVAKRLEEQWSGPVCPPYRDMLSEAAGWVVEQYREGEPLKVIGDKRPVTPTRYALWPIMPLNELTVMFADGGSGKSMLAIAWVMAMQQNQQLLGLMPGAKNLRALYLDWETHDYEQHNRFWRVANGFGLEDPKPILYRECYRPLHRDIANIRRMVEDNDVNVVVIDSIGAAVGGDPIDAAANIGMVGAIRSLRVTTLAVDHVNKTESNGKPFGSVYKFNYARAAWELKKAVSGDENQINIALLHRKANNGRLQSAMGFRLDFDGDDGPVTITRQEVADMPELAVHLPLTERIRGIIRRNHFNNEQIVEAIQEFTPESKRDTINRLISRLRQSGEVEAIAGGLRWTGKPDKPRTGVRV